MIKKIFVIFCVATMIVCNTQVSVYALEKGQEQVVLDAENQLLIKDLNATMNENEGIAVSAKIIADKPVQTVKVSVWLTNDIAKKKDYNVELGDNLLNTVIDLQEFSFSDGEYNVEVKIEDSKGNVVSKANKILTYEKKKAEINDFNYAINEQEQYVFKAQVLNDFKINSIKLLTWAPSKGSESAEEFIGEIKQGSVTYVIDHAKLGFGEGEELAALIRVIDDTGEVIDSESITIQNQSKIQGEQQDIGDELTHSPKVLEDGVAISNSSIKLENVKVTGVGAAGYWVEADVYADRGVAKVQLPTWTVKNGQDDIQWYEAKATNNHIKYYVNIKNHKYEEGKYTTHLYVTDTLGRTAVAAVKEVEIKKTPLKIKSATVTSKDATGYWVEAELQADYGVNKVQLPTWTTKNGQDDLQWYETKVTNNRIKYHVNIKNHKYEEGKYTTHLYVTDTLGRTAVAAVKEVEIKKTPLKIKSATVTSKDATGYWVEAELQADYGVSKVQLPTWTTKNGQDDLQWHETKVTNNRIRYHVDIKNHKYEEGKYTTHLYVTDTLGRTAVAAMKEVEIKKTPLKIKSATVTSKDATGYWVEAELQADYGVNKVQLPTWTTKNGQDDLQWHETKVTNNRIRYHVDIKNHRYEDGKYTTHLYVTDTLGRTAVAAMKEVEIKKTPLKIKSATVTSKDATGYWVEAELQADYGVNKVQLPTWTTKNGQDDLQWHETKVTNNRIRYHVDIKNHRYEDGKYTTHLYVTDTLGRTAVAAMKEVEIKKTPLKIKSAKITLKDATGYWVEAEFQSDYGISKVQLPTWTRKNGQDDLQWHEAKAINNRIKYRVSIKAHNFESGNYISHLYAYDEAGRDATIALNTVNLPILAPGFKNIDGSTIYVNNDGSFASGFADIGNEIYYFDTNTKEMIVGDKLIDKRRFNFDVTSGKFNSMIADIPYFNQRDARWGSKLYGNASFASTGCVPTVAAMVFSFLSEYITPDEVGDWAYYYGYLNNPIPGTKATFWGDFSGMKGAYVKGNLNLDEAIKDMKQGKMLVAAMNPGVFAGQGYTHEIVVYGIDKDNMVQVYDPYHPENNGRYHISLIFNQKSTDSEDVLSGGPIFSIG